MRLFQDRRPNKANGFHIQTCMPLDTLIASSYEVKNGNVTIARG